MYFPDSMILAAADRRACRSLLRAGSKTFFAASHVLPPSIREAATALYAFCRLADDAVDLGSDAPGDPIVRLNDRLDRAYRGQPMQAAADRAFSATVKRYAIPRDIPQALLDGLAWDASGRGYETLSDLMDYAARVAGTVGVMMALVMGVRDREALARACDLGAAMQLTNVARDVGEDARNGRLYLPRAWMGEVGLDPDDWLREPVFCDGIATLVERLLGEAERLYRRSESGIGLLPLACRPGIWAARLLYAAIGDAVAATGYDSVASRASTSGLTKTRCLARALWSAPGWGSRGPEQIPLPEARFLIDAVRPVDGPSRRRSGVTDDLLWTLELFERVERRRLEGGV